MFTAAWRRGRDFAIVEHDMGLRADTLPALVDCPRPWCAWTYPVADTVLAAFGVVRFRAEMTAFDLPGRLDAIGDDGEPARSWRRLDVRVLSVLTAAGFDRCEHSPPLPHYH